MVFSVFGMEGKLDLAPADLQPAWCCKFFGLVWLVTVLGKLEQLGASCG